MKTALAPSEHPILPIGTTDTHVHIFGPVTRYPFSPDRAFTPHEHTAAECRQMFKQMGIERAVVVQPSVYGFDNRCQLDALTELGVDARAVVGVPTDIEKREIETLHAAGARGVRINNGRPGGLMLSDLEALDQRLRDTGWHIQLVVNSSDDLMVLKERFNKIESNLVIDHIGLVMAARGVNQPGFGALLELIASGRCWIKLSGFYQLSSDLPHLRDVAPLVQRLVKERPDRLLWGSDWPHPYFAEDCPVRTEDLLRFFLKLVFDAGTQRQILVDNPKTLYGF